MINRKTTLAKSFSQNQQSENQPFAKQPLVNQPLAKTTARKLAPHKTTAYQLVHLQSSSLPTSQSASCQQARQSASANKPANQPQTNHLQIAVCRITASSFLPCKKALPNLHIQLIGFCCFAQYCQFFSFCSPIFDGVYFLIYF